MDRADHRGREATFRASLLQIDEHLDQSALACSRLSDKGDKLWIAQFVSARVTVGHYSRVSAVIVQHGAIEIVSNYAKPRSIFIFHMKLLLFTDIGRRIQYIFDRSDDIGVALFMRQAIGAGPTRFVWPLFSPAIIAEVHATI
jgi:hypothetical protein